MANHNDLQLNSISCLPPDSFLRERSSQDHEATSMMKTQFMSFWDGLITDDSCQIVVMGATNRPEDVDAAILRRMPSMFHIGLPVGGFFVVVGDDSDLWW